MKYQKLALVKINIPTAEVERAIVIPVQDLKRPGVVSQIQKILTTPGDYEVYMIPEGCDDWDAANWFLMTEITTYEGPISAEDFKKG